MIGLKCRLKQVRISNFVSKNKPIVKVAYKRLITIFARPREVPKVVFKMLTFGGKAPI